MNDIQRLREQIDSCRPGSDDLTLPELSELRQAAEHDRAVAQSRWHSHQFDKAVAAALQDVPVPAGLLDRVLASQTANLVERAAAQQAPPAPLAVPVAAPSFFWSRRWAIALGSSLAALLLIGLATFALRSRQTPTISVAELSPYVYQWSLGASSPATVVHWTRISVPTAFTT